MTEPTKVFVVCPYCDGTCIPNNYRNGKHIPFRPGTTPHCTKCDNGHIEATLLPGAGQRFVVAPEAEDAALAELCAVAYEIVQGGADAGPGDLHRILAAILPGRMEVVGTGEIYRGPDGYPRFTGAVATEDGDVIAAPDGDDFDLEDCIYAENCTFALLRKAKP